MAILARVFRENNSLFMPLCIWPSVAHRQTPLEQAGVAIACLDMREFHWGVLLQLLRLIRRHRIGLVHWNFSDPVRNSYLWWLTLLRPRVKHYYTDHFSRFFPLPASPRGWKRACQRFLLKRYTKVLCVSQFVFDCLKVQGTWSNLVCCRHFISTGRFRPDSDTRAKIRGAVLCRRVFCLGRRGTIVLGQGD